MFSDDSPQTLWHATCHTSQTTFGIGAYKQTAYTTTKININSNSSSGTNNNNNRAEIYNDGGGKREKIFLI